MRQNEIGLIESPNFSEEAETAVDMKEARAIADETAEMLKFIREVADREMEFFKTAHMEDNYALLVKKNGQTVPIKLGNEETTDGANAMLASLSPKCKMILMRKNCLYIPIEKTFEYAQVGHPGFRNFAGAKWHLILEVESKIGSMQMLIKYEKTFHGITSSPPELRCMHNTSRNKWFKIPKPESPAAWFSEC